MGRQIGWLAIMAVLLWGGGSAPATLIEQGSGDVGAAAVNFNTMVVDEIEYYIELDKSIYEHGENVEMLYRVTNLKDEDVTFWFSSSGQWNILVEKNDINIWKAFYSSYLMSTEFTLTPGENKTFTYIWDMKINQSELLSVGKYNVVGRLDIYSGLYDFTKVGVGIEVVPEPFSITFLMFGLTGVMYKRKRRSIISQHGFYG